MKTKITIFLVSFGIMMIVYPLSSKDGCNYPDGARTGYTGVPEDGVNCLTSVSYTGSSSVTGWINTKVPFSVYVSGTTDKITVTVPGAMSEMKGCELSPEKTDGKLLGILTAGTGSKKVGSGEYMANKAAMSAYPSGWTFSWTAPPCFT